MTKVLATCLVLLHLSLATSALPDVRIAGGSEVDILDYPYQVSIEYENYHKCGGAIISRIWILSAAHCVDGLPTEAFRIRLGTSYSERGGQLFNVSTIITHNNYSSTNNDSDIALLQLEKPITLTVSAQIVNLVDNEESIVEGSRGQVAGWGSQTETGFTLLILRAVEISVKSQSVCRAFYSSYEITDTMFCAGSLGGGLNACNLDDGGPLISNSRVIGIFSWGGRCGISNVVAPGVYTNVGVFRDWITEQTGI